MRIKDLKKQVNNFTDSNFDVPHKYEDIKEYAYTKEFETKEKKRFNLKVFIPSISLGLVSVILLFIFIPIMMKYTTSKEFNGPTYENYQESDSTHLSPNNESGYRFKLKDSGIEEENIHYYEYEYNNSTYIYLVAPVDSIDIKDITNIYINDKSLTEGIGENEVTKVSNYYVVYWYKDSNQYVIYSNNSNETDFITFYNETKK